MSKVAFRQHDLARAIRAAESAGWARDSFKVVIENGKFTLLPIDGAANEADDIERRMKEAFGE